HMSDSQPADAAAPGRIRPDQARRLQTAVSGIEGRAGNAASTITVRVDVNGALTGLRLETDALRLGPERPSEEIMTGVRAARTVLAAKVRAAADDVLGAENPTNAVLEQSFVQRFGAPKRPS